MLTTTFTRPLIKFFDYPELNDSSDPAGIDNIKKYVKIDDPANGSFFNKTNVTM